MSRKIIKPAFKPIGVLLRQIQGATRRAMEEALRDSGLTTAQANVLTELAYGQPRSNAELARLHSVTPQSMVEILAALERRGLISRSAKPDRGRAMPAELTKEGHSQLLSVHLAMRQVEQRLLNSLSTADISRLRNLLEACLTGIEREYSGNGSDE
ncbi:MAG TPA: MarR family transcriptional regulator [Bryobacteraceae bacterium]|nr:MarR family transcriptional regulator [Bryobacteraceae bacterium]